VTRGHWRAWGTYAGAGLVLVVLITIVAVSFQTGAARRAVVAGAAIAYGVQLIAFVALLAVREKQHLFMAGWLGGMLLRFGVLGLCLFAMNSTALPIMPLALSLVGVMFVLLMLEPVFLRWDLRASND
jgi:hypothetical protein